MIRNLKTLFIAGLLTVSAALLYAPEVRADVSSELAAQIDNEADTIGNELAVIAKSLDTNDPVILEEAQKKLPKYPPMLQQLRSRLAAITDTAIAEKKRAILEKIKKHEKAVDSLKSYSTLKIKASATAAVTPVSETPSVIPEPPLNPDPYGLKLALDQADISLEKVDALENRLKAHIREKKPFPPGSLSNLDLIKEELSRIMLDLTVASEKAGAALDSKTWFIHRARAKRRVIELAERDKDLTKLRTTIAAQIIIPPEPIQTVASAPEVKQETVSPTLETTSDKPTAVKTVEAPEQASTKTDTEIAKAEPAIEREPEPSRSNTEPVEVPQVTYEAPQRTAERPPAEVETSPTKSSPAEESGAAAKAPTADQPSPVEAPSDETPPELPPAPEESKVTVKKVDETRPAIREKGAKPEEAATPPTTTQAEVDEATIEKPFAPFNEIKCNFIVTREIVKQYANESGKTDLRTWYEDFDNRSEPPPSFGTFLRHIRNNGYTASVKEVAKEISEKQWSAGDIHQVLASLIVRSYRIDKKFEEGNGTTTGELEDEEVIGQSPAGEVKKRTLQGSLALQLATAKACTVPGAKEEK